MVVNRSPLSPQEYQEFRSLDNLTTEERKRKDVQLRYLDLRFRYMIFLGKKR